MIQRNKLTAIASVAIASVAIAAGTLATGQAGASTTTPAKADINVLTATPAGTGAIECSFSDVAIAGAPGSGTITIASDGTSTPMPASGTDQTPGPATTPGASTTQSGSGTLTITSSATSAPASGSGTPVAGTVTNTASGTATAPGPGGLIPLPASDAQAVLVNPKDVRPGTSQECGTLATNINKSH